MNNTITKMKTIIKKFISDKKGADDKNAGSAMHFLMSNFYQLYLVKLWICLA